MFWGGSVTLSMSLAGKVAGIPNHVRLTQNIKVGGFPGGAVVKKPPANARNTGSSPGPGRSHMPRSN